jgi:hypothetical protein
MITYAFFRWEPNPKLFHDKEVWVYKGKVRSEDFLSEEELASKIKNLDEFSLGFWKAHEFRMGMSRFKVIDLDYVGW